MGIELYSIEAGRFKLDGGAMFGVVPKSLWSRLNPPDDNNMCTWSMRCLLVIEGNRRILIDTGMGTKQDEKFRSHFHPHGDTDLEKSLIAKGFQPEDITDVFITHLHFDHVGGAVKYNEKGLLTPTFPNAKYWSNKRHYQWAIDPNAREKASFLRENFVPLAEQGVMEFIDIEEHLPFSDHIRIRFVYGHTEAMMIPSIALGNGKELHYCADLLPSHGHIGLPYVMAYDVRPLDTIQEKELFFEEVSQPGHYLFLEHDKDFECITVVKNDKSRIVMGETLNLGDIITM